MSDAQPESGDQSLCPRCHLFVPAGSLSLVDSVWLCRECRANRQPPRPPQEQALHFTGWQQVARWSIGDGTLMVVARALLYLALFAGIDPGSSQMQLHLHAALAGVMLGDLLAWAVCAVVDFSVHGRELPWQVLAFASANALIVGWSGHLPLPQDPYAAGFAFPFFLLTCAVKTAWWQVQRTLY